MQYNEVKCYVFTISVTNIVTSFNSEAVTSG